MVMAYVPTKLGHSSTHAFKCPYLTPSEFFAAQFDASEFEGVQFCRCLSLASSVFGVVRVWRRPSLASFGFYYYYAK